MKGIQFTLEERQLLIEALLFSSTTDVCSEWSPHQTKLMRDLAQKLNEDPSHKLSNIYLVSDLEGVEDELKSIKETFPNLPLTDVANMIKD